MSTARLPQRFVFALQQSLRRLRFLLHHTRMFDAFLLREVHFELWLQRALRGVGHYLTDVTKVGDPDMLILYLFPFVCAISRNLFIRFVLTTAICDFMNNILKWAMHGERPYWWVYQRLETRYEAKSLRQFPLTCESGPGCPSGHAMITASVWYVLTWAYVSHSAIQHSSVRRVLLVLAWSSFALLFALVATSRLYIAAHFPHQIVLGGLIGLAVGHTLTQVSVAELRARHCVQLLLTLLAAALAVWLVMFALRVDTNWAYHKALTWCRNRDWVKLSATPLSALFRDAGAIVGLGLALETHWFRQTNNLLHRDGSEVAMGVTTFVLTQAIAHVVPNPDADWLLAFYAVILVKNVLITFTSVAVVPYTVMKLMNLRGFPTSIHRQENLDPKNVRKITTFW